MNDFLARSELYGTSLDEIEKTYLPPREMSETGYSTGHVRLGS